MAKTDQIIDKLAISNPGFFKDFINSAFNGFILFDPDLNVLQINAEAERIFGVSHGIIGQNAGEIFPDWDTSGSLEKYHEVMRTGRSYEIEESVLHAKFGTIFFRIKAFKLGDGLGVFIEDLTKLKSAEKSSKLSEKRFREILETVHLIAVILDLEGNVVYCNDYLLNLTDHKMNNVKGRSWFDIFLPKPVRAKVKSVFDEIILKKKMPIHYENEIITKSGELRLIRWNNTILADESGAIYGTASIGEDITDKKRAEEFNKTILRTSMDGFSIVDANGDIRAVNDAYCLEMGYSREELLTMSIQDVEALESSEEIKDHILKLLDGAPQRFETKHRRKDGTIVEIEVSVNLVQSDEPLFFAFFRNITDRKHAEQALRESEERFRYLFENAPIAYQSLDGNGNIITVNETWCKTLGYSKQEVVGRWFGDFLTNDMKAVFKQRFPKFKSFGAIFGEEFEIVCQDGSIKIVLYDGKVRKDREGNFLQTHCVFQDVTKRKKAEHELQQSQEKLQSIVDNAPVYIYIVDLDDRFILVNKKYKDAFDLTDEMVLGKRLDEIFPDDFGNRFVKQNKTVKTRNEPINFQEDFNFDAGEKKIFHTTKFPLRDSSGKITAVGGISTDITSTRKLESELIKRDKLESVGVLAGGIAHDFNNILTAIMGNISLAKMESESGSQLNDLLTESEKATARARDLTQQLLTFSKGGAPIKKTASITEIIIDSAEFALTGSNVKCNFVLPEDLAPVEIDKGQISQVINNLVINAKQAMPQGGSIQIKCINTEINVDSGLPLKNGKYVCISVIDEGIGIASNIIDNVFDPFITTKQSGSGLGLATTYSIIKNHNGHIQVESKLSQGTTFRFYLPASENKPQLRSAKQQSVLRGCGKILVLDDEESVRILLKKILEKLGYSIDVAAEGSQAIKMYRTAFESGQPFDAVIFDLTIPGGIGGQEAVHQLRQIDPKIKAIVSSGYSNDLVMSNFKDFGFSERVAKPYKVNELGKVLQSLNLKSNQ